MKNLLKIIYIIIPDELDYSMVKSIEKLLYKKSMKMRDLKVWWVISYIVDIRGEELFSFWDVGTEKGDKKLRGAGWWFG